MSRDIKDINAIDNLRLIAEQVDIANLNAGSNKSKREYEEKNKVENEIKYKTKDKVENKRNPNNYLRFLSFLSFLLFLSVMVVNRAEAKNLGVYGALFQVVEQDIKEFIYQRLEEMKKSGAIKKINEKFVRNVKEHTVRPLPVKGITTATKSRVFYYDPTYCLGKDITDHRGKLIAASGTKINPLDTVKLNSVYLFLNADDKRQVQWALKWGKRYDYVKYLLVQGNIKTATKQLADRVYFDQYGSITHQLGIEHVPAMVKQDGKRLKIREFVPSEEGNG